MMKTNHESKTLRRGWACGVPVLALVVLMWGCAPSNEFVEPPPPEVAVQYPLVEDATVLLEFPGRTQAYARVEIRARVKGFLEQRHFQPGQYVDKGQLLFTIEPDQFEAAVRSEKGNLAKAQADLEIAKANVSRREQAGVGAVSEIDLEAARADEAAAAAAVEIAKASLADAERDLSYTQIDTPTNGRVSRDLVDRGNLVGASDPTLLTTVVQDNPVYFNFEVSERAILPYLGNRPTAERPNEMVKRPPAKMDDEERDDTQLTLFLSTGEPYPIKGEFEFIDNAVNPETGTIQVRAEFENPDGQLADGIFGRVGIPQKIEKAVMVPRAALQRDLDGSFALVVGPDNVVERRVVTPSEFTVDEYRIVEEGLTGDDLVIVSNLQRAREGITVKPVEQAADAEGPATGEAEDDPEGEGDVDVEVDEGIEVEGEAAPGGGANGGGADGN
ncbi:MAG: efflux RND transporter periplasmic adaptor subunit [Verrucomicrobiota bacterium]